MLDVRTLSVRSAGRLSAYRRNSVIAKFTDRVAGLVNSVKAAFATPAYATA